MKLKLVLSALITLLCVGFIGSTVSFATGLPALPVIGVLGGAALCFNVQPSGALMDGLYPEVWTDDLIELIDEGLKDTFLDGIVDLSRYVTGDDKHRTIHSTYFNMRPDVLIDNTAYPIPIKNLDGADKTITLNKYQTTATPITDDEQYGLVYKKEQQCIKVHGEEIVNARLRLSSFNLSPVANTAQTPVIKTTGANAIGNHRKRLRWEDIIHLREEMQAAGMPIDGMRLVLCNDHVNDLLLADKDLFNVLSNFKKGIAVSQLGFDIRTFTNNPYYDTNGNKLSFGAIPDGTHRMASFVFHPQYARKAKGKLYFYKSASSGDPLYQQTLINFRDFFIAKMVVEDTYTGAIVSDIP